jgi:general secretion pathway protein N
MARPHIDTAPSAPWAWAGVGLLAGAVASLVVSAPAAWLASRVDASTNGQVQLLDPRGTVWNGSAQLVLTGGRGSRDAAALPTRVQWSMRPSATGVRMQVSSPCCTPQPLALALRPGFGSFRVDVADGESHWPAALLSGLGTPWNTLQLEGEMQLRTRQLSVQWAQGRSAVAGTAELVAVELASRLATVRPMGSYRVTLAGGAVPAVQLATTSGPLLLSGSGQWVGSRLRFSGEASAAPEREDALANLLNIIGRRNGARSIITIG